MPDNPDCAIATADALTLLLHNQHDAATAMEVLDKNAKAITDAIMRLRCC